MIPCQIIRALPNLNRRRLSPHRRTRLRGIRHPERHPRAIRLRRPGSSRGRVRRRGACQGLGRSRVRRWRRLGFSRFPGDPGDTRRSHPFDSLLPRARGDVLGHFTLWIRGVCCLTAAAAFVADAAVMAMDKDVVDWAQRGKAGGDDADCVLDKGPDGGRGESPGRVWRGEAVEDCHTIDTSYTNKRSEEEDADQLDFPF